MITNITKRYRLRIIVPAYPEFNIYTFVAKKTTALGPVCVASAVNELENWDAEVIDENNLRGYGPKDGSGRGADHDFLQNLRPADVVGLYGGLTSTIPRLYEVAKFYKARGVVTVAGGQHFTDDNIEEALRSGVDYLILGEGEMTIRELLPALRAQGSVEDIKGVAYLKDGRVHTTPPREPITDFDRLPLPDFSLVRYARIHIYPVERIRGCGMDCEFCTVKGKPRCAPVEKLFEQISRLVETRDARHFFVVDDLFGQQRDETIRFCRILRDYQKSIARRLDLTVQIRLDKARDTELLFTMREAGVNMVAIGYESPIEEELKAMRKKIRPDEMISWTRIFHKFGFLVHGMFIFGYPLAEGQQLRMTARERVGRYKRFISKARIDTVQVLLPVPLPGTELRQRLSGQGRIYPIQDVGWEYYDGNFPVFEPDEPMTAEDMQRSVQKLMGKFYQFRYMFMIGINIFRFPTIIFSLYNIKTGWRKWYRPWRNHLVRFAGWFVVRGWAVNFKKGPFMRKLENARRSLRKHNRRLPADV